MPSLEYLLAPLLSTYMKECQLAKFELKLINNYCDINQKSTFFR